LKTQDEEKRPSSPAFDIGQEIVSQQANGIWNDINIRNTGAAN